MCTSLSYTNQAGGHFLARTMDYTLDFGAQILFIPRHYKIDADVAPFTTKYGFLGAGRKLGHEMFGDGVNEHGLGVAALYFPDNAHYPAAPAPDKFGLSPQDFIAWALGNARSIADLRQQLPKLQFVAHAANLINVVPPLHFIISDRSGQTAVLEPTSDELRLTADPVGVMTNSPDLDWHLQNLSNYALLSNATPKTPAVGGFLPKTIGPGTGAIGLPGDYTSVARFIRTVFLKRFATGATDTRTTLNLLQLILNSVTLPKGVKQMTAGPSDYTEYRAYMDLDARAYTIELYENPGDLQQVRLTTELLHSATQPVAYPLNRKPQVHQLTAG